MASVFVLVGVGRLELPASWSRTKRATGCATPRNSLYIIITSALLVKRKNGGFYSDRDGTKTQKQNPTQP